MESAFGNAFMISTSLFNLPWGHSVVFLTLYTFLGTANPSSWQCIPPSCKAESADDHYPCATLLTSSILSLALEGVEHAPSLRYPSNGDRTSNPATASSTEALGGHIQN
jgi:hypothetical protein